MKTGPQPPSKFKKTEVGVALAVIFLIAVIVVALVSHKNSSGNNSGASMPAGWATYKSSRYGFEFNYPPFWGQPQVADNKGTSGNNYTVTFVANPKAANKNLSVSIGMDSSDYVRKVCPVANNCQTINNATTDKTIQNDLKNTKSYVKHDATSYAFIVVDNSAKISNMTVKQIVNLANLKVSAAVATYQLSGSADCKSGKFASASQKSCITQSDYNNVSQVLKSIEAVD